ncbi:MAG: dihydroorotase, partial [Alphaproteobacteria bacterium]|nr:dihydroorotase [Alphaproteobacteria bacterium]
MSKYRTAYINARLIDPASGLDAPGGLLAEDGRIADVGAGLFADGVPEGTETIDCKGKVLAPGLVDMRVQLRDPGHEHMEDIGSAGLAAAAGGVTTMVCLPNTDPVIDNVAVLEFVARRAREVKLAKIHCYAAATRGMQGNE